MPCNSRRFTGQASAGDAHHIMSNSSGPSSSALHGAEHTRVGTIPHWGVFFLDEAVTVEFYANHSVHSSSESLLIQRQGGYGSLRTSDGTICLCPVKQKAKISSPHKFHSSHTPGKERGICQYSFCQIVCRMRRMAYEWEPAPASKKSYTQRLRRWRYN